MEVIQEHTLLMRSGLMGRVSGGAWPMLFLPERIKELLDGVLLSA